MKILENFAIVFIGFSYSFLVYNKIAFGIALGLGILLLMITNLSTLTYQVKKIFEQIKKLDLAVITLMIVSFSISCFLSIKSERSFAVLIYLILFIIFSIFVYTILKEKDEVLRSILKFFTISIFLNLLAILIYNISSYDGGELIKFKGTMNIITLLTIMNFYFYKSKLNYLSLILLLPNIFFTGSSASILGVISGIFICFIFFILRKFLKNISINLSVSIIFIVLITPLLIIFSKQLPQKFDRISIDNFQHSIPLQIVDIHRQFIWGFSIEKIKNKFLFGYGPDTSNFIEGSQQEIGLKNNDYNTGDMNFIPSHPHNFIVELILETGTIGSALFMLFIIMINIRVLKLCNSIESKIFLIFLNAYFWGSSLVNFSFWLGWWQGSYYLLLSLVASKAEQDSSKV